jgi:hypothetical protein
MNEIDSSGYAVERIFLDCDGLLEIVEDVKI